MYLCCYIVMEKPFTQITFDFGTATEEKEPVSAVDTVALEIPAQVGEEPVPVLEVTVPEKKPASTRGRRSLKEIALSPNLIQVPDDETLFQKPQLNRQP